MNLAREREPVFVSAVVYVRDEPDTVQPFLIELDALLRDAFESYEIIVVDDCSGSETASAIRFALDRVRGCSTVLRLSRPHGVERAILAGLDRAMGDFVFELESSDNDFHLDLLITLYRKATEGYDVVAGCPAQVGWYSRLFYRFINRVSYLRLNLFTEAVRLVSRRALNAMLNLREKVRYRKALYALTGYARTQVTYLPLKPRNRRLNKENVTLALDVVVSFSDWGLKLSHYIAFGFFVFSVSMVFYALYNYFFRNVVEGWTTIVITLGMGFSGVFLVLGLMGEYLGRLLIEVQNRPFYSVEAVAVYPEKQDVTEEGLSESDAQCRSV